MLLVLVTTPTVFGEENQTSLSASTMENQNWYKEISFWQIFFSAISASAIVSIVTFAYSWKRDKRMEIKSNFIDIVKMIGDEEVRKSRGVLLNNKDKLIELQKESNLYNALTNLDQRKILPLNELEQNIIDAFEKVIVSYDRLGFILEQDKHLRNKILDWDCHTIAKQWNLLGRFVEELQVGVNREKVRYFNVIGKMSVKIDKEKNCGKKSCK